MAHKCNELNTDYRTKKAKPFVQKRNNEVVIWHDKNKCTVIKQLVINFKLT